MKPVSERFLSSSHDGHFKSKIASPVYLSSGLYSGGRMTIKLPPASKTRSDIKQRCNWSTVILALFEDA